MQTIGLIETPEIPAPVVKAHPAAKSLPRRPDPRGEYHGWRADVGCLADHWEDTHVVFLLGSLRSLGRVIN